MKRYKIKYTTVCPFCEAELTLTEWVKARDEKHADKRLCKKVFRKFGDVRVSILSIEEEI